jgi:hypothetical protein
MIKLASLITEIRSPHPPAKDSDEMRGFVGIVANGVVYAYDQMVPDIWHVDHSEIEYGSANRERFRYQHTTNCVYWNYFPPDLELKETVEEWLLKKGIQITAHRSTFDRTGRMEPPVFNKH